MYFYIFNFENFSWRLSLVTWKPVQSIPEHSGESFWSLRLSWWDLHKQYALMTSNHSSLIFYFKIKPNLVSFFLSFELSFKFFLSLTHLRVNHEYYSILWKMKLDCWLRHWSYIILGPLRTLDGKRTTRAICKRVPSEIGL